MSTLTVNQQRPLLLSEGEGAAQMIQRHWRGYLGRIEAAKVRQSLLSFSLFEKAFPYVLKDHSLCQKLPRSTHGKTQTFFLKEHSLVLKQSGFPQNKKRLVQMQEAKEVCRRNGYSLLQIPKARTIGAFVVEEELPIHSGDTKEGIGHYLRYRDFLNSAVREFTGFLCQSTLSDIAGGEENNPYQSLSTRPIPRYDNVAPLSNGTIALIDLEGFSSVKRKAFKGWCAMSCRDVVSLFPYHLDSILEVARNFDPEIEKYRSQLEGEAVEVRKFFRLAYEDHFEWIRQRRIPLIDPFQPIQMTAEEQLVIQEGLIEALRRADQHLFYQGCLGGDPEQTLLLFQTVFPFITQRVEQFVASMLQDIKLARKRPIETIWDLPSCRTITFSFVHKKYAQLRKDVSLKLQMFDVKDDSIDGFSAFLIESLFQELAKKRVIAYSNPHFGQGRQIKHCLFC